jgi:hypothetical protein
LSYNSSDLARRRDRRLGCSTLSGSAERLAQEIETPVVRIDRPMAESAVAHGGRVALVVAIDSTLAPTRQLFEECAANAGSEVTFVDAQCLGAWERFEAGDHDGYLDCVARHVRALAEDVDIVVLAQASMAPGRRSAQGSLDPRPEQPSARCSASR